MLTARGQGLLKFISTGQGYIKVTAIFQSNPKVTTRGQYGDHSQRSVLPKVTTEGQWQLKVIARCQGYLKVSLQLKIIHRPLVAARPSDQGFLVWMTIKQTLTSCCVMNVKGGNWHVRTTLIYATSTMTHHTHNFLYVIEWVENIDCVINMLVYLWERFCFPQIWFRM